MMLKDQGIHEGNWVFAANLSFAAMNFGQLPDGSDASPAGVVAVTGVLNAASAIRPLKTGSVGKSWLNQSRGNQLADLPMQLRQVFVDALPD